MVRKLHRKCVTRTGLNANFHFIQIPTASKNLQLHYKFYITQPLSGECLWIHKTGINIYARIWKNFFSVLIRLRLKRSPSFFAKCYYLKFLSLKVHILRLCVGPPHCFAFIYRRGAKRIIKRLFFFWKFAKMNFWICSRPPLCESNLRPALCAVQSVEEKLPKMESFTESP